MTRLIRVNPNELNHMDLHSFFSYNENNPTIQIALVAEADTIIRLRSFVRDNYASSQLDVDESWWHLQAFFNCPTETRREVNKFQPKGSMHAYYWKFDDKTYLGTPFSIDAAINLLVNCARMAMFKQYISLCIVFSDSTKTHDVWTIGELDYDPNLIRLYTTFSLAPDVPAKQIETMVERHKEFKYHWQSILYCSLDPKAMGLTALWACLNALNYKCDDIRTVELANHMPITKWRPQQLVFTNPEFEIIPIDGTNNIGLWLTINNVKQGLNILEEPGGCAHLVKVLLE